ncbi:hypothetical protein C8J56DRAFT_37073 [Mycena floridula]|nr:hypothetical protein C8J56DRAFT_37073 [Mycena floridula]
MEINPFLKFSLLSLHGSLQESSLPVDIYFRIPVYRPLFIWIFWGQWEKSNGQPIQRCHDDAKWFSCFQRTFLIRCLGIWDGCLTSYRRFLRSYQWYRWDFANLGPAFQFPRTSHGPFSPQDTRHQMVFSVFLLYYSFPMTFWSNLAVWTRS